MRSNLILPKHRKISYHFVIMQNLEIEKMFLTESFSCYDICVQPKNMLQNMLQSETSETCYFSLYFGETCYFSRKCLKNSFWIKNLKYSIVHHVLKQADFRNYR